MRRSDLFAAALMLGIGSAEAQEPRPAPSDALLHYQRQRGAVVERVRTLMRRVDGNEFAERESATKDLEAAVGRLKFQEPRLGNDVRELLTTGLSPEQKLRVGPIATRATAFAPVPSKLDIEGTVRGEELVRLWANHLRIDVGYEDEKIALRFREQVDVRKDMTYAQTIAALCATTDTMPVSEARSLRFVQRLPDTEVTGGPWAVGIVRTQDDGSKAVRALAEPGYGAVVTMQHRIVDEQGLRHEWQPGDTVVVPSNGKDSTWVHAGLVLEPKVVSLGANGTGRAGFQVIETESRRTPKGWRTTVRFQSTLSPNAKEGQTSTPRMIDDPVAPRGFDPSACATNRVTLLNGYGTAIHPTHAAVQVVGNGAEFDIDTSERPARVDAHAWTVYTEQMINLPLTPPAPRQAADPASAVRPESNGLREGSPE